MVCAPNIDEKNIYQIQIGFLISLLSQNSQKSIHLTRSSSTVLNEFVFILMGILCAKTQNLAYLLPISHSLIPYYES